MTNTKSIGLTRESQQQSYEQAKELVKEDMEEEDPTEGQVVEHLADAYMGNI